MKSPILVDQVVHNLVLEPLHVTYVLGRLLHLKWSQIYRAPQHRVDYIASFLPKQSRCDMVIAQKVPKLISCRGLTGK